MTVRLPISAILASLLVHAVFSAPFFLPGQSGVRTTEVAFVDLTAEISPVRAQQVVVPPKPDSPPLTEVPPVRTKVASKAVVRPAPEEKKSEVPPEAEPETPAEAIAEEQPALGLSPPASAQNDFILGLSRGFFETIGSGRTLHPEVRDYYMAMLETVNRRWWGEAIDHRNIRQEVMAVVVIGRNGLLLDGWIARSSGNSDLDELVLSTIRAAAPFPPLPEDFLTDYFQAPIRLVPPASAQFGKPDVPPHGLLPVPST